MQGHAAPIVGAIADACAHFLCAPGCSNTFSLDNNGAKMRSVNWLRIVCITAGVTLASVSPTIAAPGDGVLPTTWQHSAAPIASVDTVEVPPIDMDQVIFEDQMSELEGMAPRFAVPWGVNITPDTDGSWEQIDSKTMVWRLRITSPGALSLNLGFTRYNMPHNGRLHVYAVDGTYSLNPYTERDNAAHGELWTPVVLADDIMVEVSLPIEAVNDLDLELTAINHGYRGFGEADVYGDRSGTCNNDVVCPEGDDWRSEIPSVGVISTGGSTFCTGFMVNNTAQDETPYFMTANHCGISSSNAASLVVYWNFESPNCGQQGGGSLAQNQTGSFFRASYSTSDFTLVELDSDPDPSFGITFAGWDHGGANATTAIGIHHPNTDEKSISFEYQSTQVTSYLGTSVPGDGTHVRIIDWDDGTTEPGSSGSPLFDQNHHVIGQLHGGYAACGNDDSDWYGAFQRSWAGGGSNSSRLSNWLDPIASGATAIDTLDPQAVGMKLTPGGNLVSGGDPGGPFTPSSIVYTIENQGDAGFNYSVTKSAAWVSITNASGFVGVGGNASVTVSINSNANSFGIGAYSDTVYFTNTTTGEGDTQRAVQLQVGVPSLVYSWDLSTNPGWTTQGSWAYGTPTGGGGEHGNNDPTGGYTGSSVYGYNLNGDYTNNMSEQHLTTTAIDCSDLADTSVRFRRWLGVEQPSYDHAYVRVSNNGTTWTTVWENSAEIADSAWSLQEYDISAVADGQATVYVRWTQGTTDGSWLYCGWNIDDVEIWGLDTGTGVVIPGDMDGDGDVDLADLADFLAVYGTCSGDPGYNPVADLDDSGCVNLADLSALLSNYGA